MSKLSSYIGIGGCKNGLWFDDDTIIYVNINENGSNIVKKYLPASEEKILYNSKNTIWSLNADVENDMVFFTVDTDGDENEQVYMIKGGGAPTKLTDSPKVKFSACFLAYDGKTLVTASNERQKQTFDIVGINIETGERRIILENTDNYNSPSAMSPDRKLLLYNKMMGPYNNALWMVNVETGKACKTPSDAAVASYLLPVWKKDSSGFYVITDVGDEFKYVAFYDISSDKLTPVFKCGWDVTNIALSPKEDLLAIVVNEAGYSKLNMYSLEHGAFIDIPQPPKGLYAVYDMLRSDSLVFAPGKGLLLSSAANSKRAHDLWVLDFENDVFKRVTKAYTGGLTQWDLTLPELKEYKSFDGLTVPYWLYIPKGLNGKNMPVFIDIHGGPEGQSMPFIEGFAQYLVSEGFAVVKPNVRGSTGYGRTYEKLDNAEKRLDSVKDINSLVESLIKEGIADKEKIVVSGISYGGFMTLSCAARYPDLWCCAVDIVGILNLETLLENTSAYRRPHREAEYGQLSADREMLRSVSPIAEIDSIKGPIMIVHGENDPRVPISESRNAVEYLSKKGVEVEFIVYDDEGHGVHKLNNRIDCYTRIVAFIKKHMKIG